MDPLVASLMAIGSGSAAGLRPYFTVFVLGLTGLLVPENAPAIITYATNQIPDTIADPWVVGVCGFLALAECVGGKFPAVDLILEPITAWLRPIIGTFIGLQLGLSSGVPTAAVTALLGAGTALPVSLGKMSFTGATTAATGGTLDWLRSFFEDASALTLALTAIFVPVLAALLGLLAVACGIALFLVFRKVYRAIKAKFGRFKESRARVIREAQCASDEKTSVFESFRRLQKRA